MSDTQKTLLAADLADRWIDEILSNSPSLILLADCEEPEALSTREMAQRIAQFRATLIDELQEQPINDYGNDDYDEFDEDDDDDYDDDDK